MNKGKSITCHGLTSSVDKAAHVTHGYRRASNSPVDFRLKHLSG